MDVAQSARMYVYFATTAQGLDEYHIDGSLDYDTGYGGAQTDELGNKIFRNPSTGVYRLVFPDGSSKSFPGGGGRISELADRNGNTLSIGTDSGILDTVAGPDDRYLQFLWDSYGRISSVALCKFTGGGQSVALRSVGYSYTDTTSRASLSRVTYSDSSYNEFTYAKRYSTDSYDSYITDFRDRAGVRGVLLHPGGDVRLLR